MSEKPVSADEIIFREGDVPDNAYILVSGSVELSYYSQNKEVKLATLKPGAIFGELALFDNAELRNNTAAAIADSVVKVVSAEEFSNALERCPEIVKPFITAAFERFIPAKTRPPLSTHTIARSDINKITISASDDTLKAHLKTLILTPETLPFRIGGYPEGGEKKRKDNVQLGLPSHYPPLIISRQHFEISIENEVIGITDLGSRFGTIVNGRAIGRGRGTYFLPLQKGENSVILGQPESTYRISLLCE